MSWSTPKTDWTADDVLTTTLLDNIGNNLRYLKGLDGSVAIDDDITITGDITASGIVTASASSLFGGRYPVTALTKMKVWTSTHFSTIAPGSNNAEAYAKTFGSVSFVNAPNVFITIRDDSNHHERAFRYSARDRTKNGFTLVGENVGTQTSTFRVSMLAIGY